MTFLQKRALLYVKSHYSEGTFATTNGAHEVAQHDFSLQQGSFCCSEYPLDSGNLPAAKFLLATASSLLMPSILTLSLNRDYILPAASSF